MSTKSPVFPMPEPQHFSDYGFDPQIDFFQVLGEARRHRRETASTRPIDSIHFKLQKPISKDDSSKSKRSSASSSSSHHKKTKARWWRNALLFFKQRWPHRHSGRSAGGTKPRPPHSRPPSISGPIYLTDSRSGPVVPCRTASRPSSGPLAGTLTPARKGEVEVPYLCLQELDMEPQPAQRISTSALPIYLVT